MLLVTFPMMTQRFQVTLEFMLTSSSLWNARKSVAPEVITRRENSSDFAANVKPLLIITCRLKSAILLTMISLFLRSCQITTVTPILYIMLWLVFVAMLVKALLGTASLIVLYCWLDSNLTWHLVCFKLNRGYIFTFQTFSSYVFVWPYYHLKQRELNS